MNIFKHYQNNKKDKMPLIKNLKDIFFHLHNGKKRVIICVISMILNYLSYKHNISSTEWLLLLSSEFFILKIAEALTNEVSI